MFDNVKFEKEKAIARFKRFRGFVKLRQFLEILSVFALISWSSARVPAIAGGYFLEFSAYLLNHHVVFLIGNAIIVLLVMLCRRNDVSVSAGGGGGHFYDEYVKYSDAAAVQQREATLPPPLLECDEKMVVASAEWTEAIPPCDDVAEAIAKATKQIRRFERAQSERLKREIGVPPRPELRRSETGKIVSSVGFCDVADEMETLSSEEFRRRVDAFIDQHWGKRTTKRYQFEERENYQLVKM